VDCHIMVDGKGYNGVSMDEINAAAAVREEASTR
jgi:hypothetical protein